MADLALKTKDLGYRLEAVQDFTPTPMTVATEIYATGRHPIENRPVSVARTPEEKQEQRSFFFWYKPEMKQALRGTLQRLGLKDMARRLLDEKQVTRDVTPAPKINPVKGGMTTAPCGMKVPQGAPGLPKGWEARNQPARPPCGGGSGQGGGQGGHAHGGKKKPVGRPFFTPPKNGGKSRRD
jgi:hypothetical protein